MAQFFDIIRLTTKPSSIDPTKTVEVEAPMLVAVDSVAWITFGDRPDRTLLGGSDGKGHMVKGTIPDVFASVIETAPQSAQRPKAELEDENEKWRGLIQGLLAGSLPSSARELINEAVRLIDQVSDADEPD